MSADSNSILFTSSIPFSSDRLRALVVCCSDGRFGSQFEEFVEFAVGTPRLDRVVLPGGPASLLGKGRSSKTVQSLHDQLEFLIDMHQLDQVILINHDQCAFYSDFLRVDSMNIESRQMDDLREAIDVVQQMGSNLRVNGYFARIMPGGNVQFEGVD